MSGPWIGLLTIGGYGLLVLVWRHELNRAGRR